ncbi:Serine--tRNA ligase, cytoplasmic [Hondaea fermentalgiana]|uniref:serine--tRNA ligase n=1 Tax=Hondaea fermentalgiana TaxID=2315210 RepID=A0A2R5G8X3_9STRA|nr:Serine--tRNA ligase, cytoplasmic [Hondaea fermentalgiana]|eukprot:GBG24114.1 Serine--tRNA ligase, cytoplasmic [Hondaea fermentalgiana]
MPLGLPLFRDPESLEQIRKSHEARFPSEQDKDLVDRIVKADEEWRQLEFDAQKTKEEKNAVSKLVGQKKKNKENADEEQAKARELGAEVERLQKAAEEKRAELDTLLPLVGNLVHPSVVVHDDEDYNKIESTYGEKKPADGLQAHNQLLWRIDGYEPERGNKTAGHRGYFLKGPAVMLNQALITYSLQFLTKKGYTPLQPPYFMNKDVMAGVAQLSDFDESLYHVTGEKGDNEKYLIATSEQPICAYHMGDWMQDSDLPIRYAGMSTCFRKEAGKAGKDTWGIFRVHQFDKVEQFCITTPEKSWEMHEEMRNIAEEFLQSLDLPYQVVNIVSGELNNAAAKKYDIEAWFPSYQEYKELVSCSNCTDYQARAMNIRFGEKQDKQYAHMLNSTLCALTRTISCILENYQEKDGVRVPAVLVPYMAGMTFIPFVREPMENKAEKKQQKAKAKKAAAK